MNASGRRRGTALGDGLEHWQECLGWRRGSFGTGGGWNSEDRESLPGRKEGFHLDYALHVSFSGLVRCRDIRLTLSR
jgi:hypothetical protein